MKHVNAVSIPFYYQPVCTAEQCACGELYPRNRTDFGYGTASVLSAFVVFFKENLSEFEIIYLSLTIKYLDL